MALASLGGVADLIMLAAYAVPTTNDGIGADAWRRLSRRVRVSSAAFISSPRHAASMIANGVQWQTKCADAHYQRERFNRPSDVPIGELWRKGKCCASDCDHPHHAKGFCRKHYWAAFRTHAGVDQDMLRVTSQGLPPIL